MIPKTLAGKLIVDNHIVQSSPQSGSDNNQSSNSYPTELYNNNYYYYYGSNYSRPYRYRHHHNHDRTPDQKIAVTLPITPMKGNDNQIKPSPAIPAKNYEEPQFHHSPAPSISSNHGSNNSGRRVTLPSARM